MLEITLKHSREAHNSVTLGLPKKENLSYLSQALALQKWKKLVEEDEVDELFSKPTYIPFNLHA